MDTGADFVRKIKPIGCVAFLMLFAVFLVFCFTAKAPVEGYSVPHDSQYFAEHIDELKTELETNLFPHLDGIEECRVEGDKLVIVIDSEHFAESSKAISHYYGNSLFEFTEK